MNRVEIHKHICDQLNKVYSNKNHDYGNAFYEIRKKYPYSVNIRLWDKLMRLDKLISNESERYVEDEKIEDTLLDMANYCIMELIERIVEKDSEHEISRWGSINS